MLLRLPNKRLRGVKKTVRTFASDFDIPSGVTGVHLTNLEAHHCRFPVDRVDGHTFFCGEPRKNPRSSYCETHHPIVWHKARSANDIV